MSGLTTPALDEHLWNLFEIMRRTKVPLADCRELLIGLIVLKAALDRAELSDEWLSTDVLLVPGGELPTSHAVRPSRPEAWVELSARSEEISLAAVTSLARSIVNRTRQLEGVFEALFVAAPARTPWVQLIEHLGRYRLDPASLEDPTAFGAALEGLIVRSSEATRSAGETTTRPEAARLLAELANVTPGMRVHDPASGSCQLLVESARAVTRAGGDPASLRLSGTDVDAGQWAIGRAHLWAHGLNGVQVLRRDALLGAGGAPAERILCQPPFGLQVLESESTGEPIESMFLEHIVATLDPVGRAVVMLPEQFLYHKKTEARRRQLMDQGILEAVIRVPSRLLLSSAVPVSVVVLDCTREHHHVVFASAEVGGDIADGVELSKVIRLATGEAASRVARAVPEAQIVDEGFSLDPDRFFAREGGPDSGRGLVDTFPNQEFVVTSSQANALVRLVEASRQGGIVNLVGDYGTGKSALCRMLRDRLVSDGAEVVFMVQPRLDTFRRAIVSWQGREGRLVLIIDEWEVAAQSLRPHDAADLQRLLHFVLKRGPMSAVVFVSTTPLAEMHNVAALSLLSTDLLARIRTVRLAHNFREALVLSRALAALRNSLVHSRVPRELVEQVLGGLSGLSLRELGSVGGPEALAREYAEIEAWGRFLRDLGHDNEWILNEATAQGFDLNDPAASFAAFIWRTKQRPESFGAALMRPSDLKRLFPTVDIMRPKEEVLAEAFEAWRGGGERS